MLLQAPVPAPSVWSEGLTPELDRVVRKALERNVDARFQSAHEFAEALRGAAGEGSRSEVAAWVNGLATEGLARRLELLQELEASAIHTQAAISSSALDSEATLPSRSMQTQVAVPHPMLSGSTPYAASTARSDATHTKANTVTSIVPNPPARGWHQSAPWLFAAAGVGSALGVWLLASSPEPTRNTGSLEPTGPNGAAAALAATPRSAPTGDADEESQAADLPVIAAESMPLAPLPAPTVVAKRVERRPVVKPSATPRAAAVRAAACSPPYRIDASGVRRVKPECI
jgi:serine/threonine-protein kinase